MSAKSLEAPFPYFGGKSRAAELIWERFGDVPNYCEPFAGSLAVLLARPTPAQTETCNDLDGLLSNAWRSIRLDPDVVAFYADAPVSECDLHAYHVTLVNAREKLTERLMADPEFCDPKLAGWWILGVCNWIGGGYCSGQGPWNVKNGLLVNRRELEKEERGEVGVWRQLPHLGDAGVGVSRKLPHLGDAGKGVSKPTVSNPGLYQWMRELSERLRRTRIACGDWRRVTGDSVTTKHGITAVLLDPPYDATNADNDVYGSTYDAGVAAQVRQWAIENGDNPKFRIALCSYEDGHEMPQGWTKVPWKARKGYGKVQTGGTHNGHREIIWFSPYCLKPAAQAQLWEAQ